MSASEIAIRVALEDCYRGALAEGYDGGRHAFALTEADEQYVTNKSGGAWGALSWDAQCAALRAWARWGDQ